MLLCDSLLCAITVGAAVRIIILCRGRHARTRPHAGIPYIYDHHLFGTRQLEDPKASAWGRTRSPFLITLFNYFLCSMSRASICSCCISILRLVVSSLVRNGTTAERVGFLSKNITSLSHEGPIHQSDFSFRLHSSPLLLCNVVIFFSLGVTLIHKVLCCRCQGAPEFW